MMPQRIEQNDHPRASLYILGAGFSRPAGLPLATELWAEVVRRGLSMEGRACQFRSDLNDYINFKRHCDGQDLTFETVNFEDFLGFLDIEHYLRLRGRDTWSDEGNEGQIVTKTLIGQVLMEKTPSTANVPKLYIEFAKKLQPYDTVITFNYDILLERALDAAAIPYRLFPDRYESVFRNGAICTSEKETEVVILKMHGSVDWFNRRRFRLWQEDLRRQGQPPSLAVHPIFDDRHSMTTSPLLQGPHFPDNPLWDMHRLTDIEWFYADPPWFMATPTLINPSTMKLVYARVFSDFWHGLGRMGAANLRMAVIGYSMPEHDDYARQALYRLITNYQHIPTEKVFPYKVEREEIQIVDYRPTETDVDEFKRRYRFIDWRSAKLHMNGFNQAFVEGL